ncbi:MAG: pilus assembly protein [Rhizobiales bacterium]|nr:pilus assembly protein [Hyphomicrobiales bacterium]
MSGRMRFGPRHLRRFARAEQGIAAIEMALIFPVMLLLYFGLVDITNLLSANRRVTLAASTLGDLVTQQSETIKKADLNGIYAALAPIMDPFPSNNVKIQIFGYKKSGSSAVLSWSNSKNGSCGSAPSTAGLANLMTDGNDLVISRVCVDYPPITGRVIGSDPVTLQDEVILRPRQSNSLACTDC